MKASLARTNNRFWLLSFFALVLGLVAANFLLSQKAEAAPTSSYPTCCSAETYVAVSKSGGGTALEAPFTYVKVKYGGDTVYHDITVSNGCFYSGIWGVDNGGPTSGCVGGQGKFWVCPSTADGGFDDSYKGAGRCYENDAANFGGSDFLLRFSNGANNPQAGSLILPTAPNGYKYLYFIAQQISPGLNGFKLSAAARNGSLGLATYSRIGFMATQGVNRPVSLVNLPLTPGGSTSFRFTIKVPCGFSAGGSFRIAWHDADRGAGGSPQDYDIDWSFINRSIPYGSDASFLTAGEAAFYSGQSYETYLGGNGEDRSQPIGNSEILTMRPGDVYDWEWYNVNLNNGVQVLLPFDEVDSDEICDAPKTGNNEAAGCSAITGWVFDGDQPNGNMYNQNGTLNNTTGSMLLHLYKDGVMQGQYVADLDRTDVNSAYGITGNHGYNVSLAAYADGAAHTFTLYALGVDTNGYPNGVNTPPIFNSSIGPCYPPPGCSPAVQLVELNTPAILTATLGNGTYSWSGGGSPSTGSAPTFTTIYSSLGQYTVTLSSGGQSTTCSIGIVAKPYFSLVNGDIATGMGTCPGWGIGTGGTLISWNNGGLGAANLGSGSNLAAYALGIIDGFASGQPTSGSTAPISLSFANTTPITEPFGGSFGNTIPCPADYYGMLDTGSATPITSNSSVPNTNDVYDATGNFKLNNGAVTAGNRPIIYVNGDVFIEGNVTTSSGATLSSLSNFYLVVKGDIYISPDVARLDGVYVAQPRSDGTGGRIYTCSRNGAYQPPLASQLNGVSGGGLSSCMSQLTVNGAFIAKELKLYRSIGSMSTGTPAEVFNYTPATWLAVPESIINRTSGSGYHSITSLPPIL